MPIIRNHKVHAQCYKTGKSTFLQILGIVLIAIGVLLILFCVPCWAWLSLLGLVLVVLGLILIKK